MRIFISGPAGSAAASESRSVRLTNSASSGSPRKESAAPSPVSRMMRSLIATFASASVSSAFSRSLSWICSETGFFE